MKKAPEMDYQPVNALESFMAHVSYRLDVIIEQNNALIAQNNSVIDYLSKQGNVAVEENKTEVLKVEKAKKEVKKPVKK